MTALVKANRFIYNNKAKVVEIAVKYTQQDADAVAQTYDILANAGAWPVNDGLPKDMVEWTINNQVELGTIKAEDKPSYEKLVDLSIIEAALTKAGGRLKGDKRWDEINRGKTDSHRGQEQFLALFFMTKRDKEKEGAWPAFEVESPFGDPVEIPLQDSLDLHPFLPKDIPSVVEEYLEQCKRGRLSRSALDSRQR